MNTKVWFVGIISHDDGQDVTEYELFRAEPGISYHKMREYVDYAYFPKRIDAELALDNWAPGMQLAEFDKNE